MALKQTIKTITTLFCLLTGLQVFAQGGEIDCISPPPAACDRETGCSGEDFTAGGNASDPVTGRSYFLDYPCDLAPGEPVNFILSIHGAGSIGNWHRHYFPAYDYVDDYNLVIATPTSLRDGPVPMWTNRDDEHLQAIVDQVIEKFGRENIRSFWLAGHSQGGMTSNRIVCTPFFRDKVDGWLSLSGGRFTAIEVPAEFFGDEGIPEGLEEQLSGSGAGIGKAGMVDCDFSYIFATGENEMVELPDASSWAEKYQCSDRESLTDIIDQEKGYVSARDPSRGAAWGLDARPGTANRYVYPDCNEGLLVADVVRLDKGHTEGLEPEVTRSLLEMMLEAPAGKLQQSR